MVALTLAGYVSGNAEVKVQSADERGLTIAFRPALAIYREDSSGVYITLDGADQIELPGKPLLPVQMITAAVPPDSRPTVRVVRRTSGKTWQGLLKTFEPRDTTSRTETGFGMPQAGEIVGALQTRSLAGFKVVRIPVYPVSYNSSAHRIELADQIELRVDFNRSRTGTVELPVRSSRLAKQVIVNYDQLGELGGYRTSSFTELSWPSGYIYRFEVEQEGIYKLAFEQMVQRGVKELGTGIPSENLKLFGNGGAELFQNPDTIAPAGVSECAIYINDGDDGIFGPGDWMLFYGKGAGGYQNLGASGWNYGIHHYDLRNIYWLNLDPAGGGRRMAGFTEDLLPDTVVSVAAVKTYTEPDRFIFAESSFPGSGIQWYGFSFDGPSRINFNVTTPDPDSNRTAILRTRTVNIAGSGRVEISINNELIGSFIPNNNSASFSFPGGILNQGTNVIAFDQVNQGARVFFDWLEVTYGTRLDEPAIFEAPVYSGTVKYNLSGMQDPWIFEVTSHCSVAVEKQSEVIVSQAHGLTRRFALTRSDAFLSVNQTFENYFPPSDEYEISDIWSPTNTWDLLLIVPDGYWDAIPPLIEHYHRRTPPLRAARVRLSEIYNRFSGGLKDPGAIRNLLHYAQDYWEDPPDFIMLCGDGDYNYRDIDRPATTDLLPPYEQGRLCSDDWFTDFTKWSGPGDNSPLPEMAISRLTAQTAPEMSLMIDKIIAYTESPEFGPWRNTVTLVADDEYGESSGNETDHVTYTEDLSVRYIPSSFDRDKIYLTEYPRQWGREKPRAADALLTSINRGTLMVNYMGHGNPTLWAHEHVFVLSRDLPRIEPSRRQPLYLAFTCDWAYWDDPTSQSFPEQLLAMPDGGAIGAIASTRLTWGGANNSLAQNFFRNLFSSDSSSVAEALALAKHQYRGGVNSAGYHLLGDVAMVLGFPRGSGAIDALTPYPLAPLGRSSVSGRIFADGERFDSDFSGELDFILLDTEVPKTYIVTIVSNESVIYIPLNYTLPGPLIYRGLLSVTGGRFHGNFTVPRDVTLGGTLGRAVAYYHNELGDGVVSLDSVLFADRVAEAADTIPPQIQLFFDQRAWRPGDRISPKPLLIVDLFDSSGLNLTGAMGHGVALSLDGGKAMDLTPYFAYNLDSYQTGTLETRIGPLTPGIHQLEIQAWDGFNNLTVQKTEVEVIPSSDGFSIERVYNWPNPFRESTQLTFTVNQPADYEILIYTVGGRLIWDWKGAALAAGMIADAVWDGRDHAGRRVGNGVYLYKVKAWNGDGAPAEGLGKIVYVR